MRVETLLMPRGSKETLGKTVGFRIPKEHEQIIERLMRDFRRNESDVCRFLLERGIAAYQQDGRLFEGEKEAIYERNPSTRMTDPGRRKQTTGERKKTGTINR
jgi:hypothetical protein